MANEATTLQFSVKINLISTYEALTILKTQTYEISSRMLDLMLKK